MQNVTLIWKEDFGPLSNSPVYFLLSPGKMLLTMFLFQKWLGSLFLKMSERGDSWCTDSSFSSLLLKLSQVFELALLDSIFKLAVIPISCAHFPTHFFLPVNFACNMLWYSTHWTAPPPPLSVMTLCDLPSLWRVSIIVFWTIAKSAVFPIIVVSKNKRYPQLILYGYLLLKLKCKYYNILRYWFLIFISCKL